MWRSQRLLALIGVAALGASVVAGFTVHGVREGRMGLAREEGLTVESVGDALRAAMWEVRVALADLAFVEASVVFHRGLRHHEELEEEPSPLRPWIPEHVHDMDNVGEMMPWVWMTTHLNPHHTRAYAMGGYFLSWQLERTDVALEYLNEGLEHNPDDGLISLTLGRIHMMHRRDPAAALPFFRAALASGLEDPEDELFATRYLAHALRLTGRWEEGLTLWEEQTAAHPEDPAFGHGFETYQELVSDPETRESFDLHELGAAEAAALEDDLCPFGHDHDHSHDHHHAHGEHEHHQEH